MAKRISVSSCVSVAVGSSRIMAPGLPPERPHDLQQLLLRAGKRLNPSVDVQVDAKLSQDI